MFQARLRASRRQATSSIEPFERFGTSTWCAHLNQYFDFLSSAQHIEDLPERSTESTLDRYSRQAICTTSLLLYFLINVRLERFDDAGRLDSSLLSTQFPVYPEDADLAGDVEPFCRASREEQ